MLILSRTIISFIVLFLLSMTGVLINSALGAHFEYAEGTFGGQRGAGLIFEGACPDPGVNWIGHWCEIPDPNPLPAVEMLRCYNPVAGDARVTTRQEGLVSAFGGSLGIWNHGQVKAIASSVGTRQWQVFSRSGNQAHADSTLQKLGFRIMPGMGEDFGDPVWLTFNVNYLVNHSIGFQWTRNSRRYSQWTDFRASDGSLFQVKGIFGGPYPAPFTVYLREDGAVRGRPVLRAQDDFDHSSRIFNGERIPAHIGDLVILDGGVLPWLTIDASVPVGGGAAFGSETATSDMILDTRIGVSEAEEFELSGPLEINSTERSISCASEFDETLGGEPWNVEIVQSGCRAQQTSEITGYWLSAAGSSAGDARSFYRVEFTLDEDSSYQLHMILDGSADDGISSFNLSGPSPISHTKSSSDRWIPLWERGELQAGDYALEVEARPEGINKADSEAWFDFDLTFGKPTRVPPPPPPGTVINVTFVLGQNLEDLGFTVTALTGSAAIVGNPVDFEDDGALWLQDPGDGTVVISKPITVEPILKVELEYLFKLPGKLEIGLDGILLDTLYAEGSSHGFVFYTKEFALTDYGLTPGDGLPFTLKLSNPDAVDPEMYLDNLLVSTGDSYTGNAPPSRPEPTSPANGAIVDTLTPTLEIANSDDENGDEIRYAFEVFADPELTALVVWATDVEPGSAGSTAWLVDTPLQDNTTYYWRAIATDQREASSVSVVNSFRVSTSGENQPPVALCQDVTVAADDSCQASADVNNGSFDPDGDAVTLVQSPAGPYALGSTAVALTVTDDWGDFDTCSAIVTVVDDTTPVVVSITASPNVLWPPNHKMVPVTVSVSVEDNCDAEPVCRITSVSSNEADFGLTDGDKAPDWEITGDLTLKLRAERAGTGNGRIYTIAVECSDAAGNSESDTVTVTVPHDQGKNKE